MAVVIRAAIFYVFLVLVLRVTTRRVIRSATPLDMVIIFLLGGFAMQAVLGADRSMVSAALAIITVAVVHVILSAVMPHWPWVGWVVEGTPVIVFRNGRWDDKLLRQLRVHRNDILAEARQNGSRSMDEIDTVIIEHNGGITILQKPS